MIGSTTTLGEGSAQSLLWGFVASWLAYSNSPARERAVRSVLNVQTVTWRNRVGVIDTPIVILEGEDTFVVGIGGTDNAYLWLNYLYNFGMVNHADLRGSVFEPFLNGANSALARMPNSILAGYKKLVFSGHSFGGACAEVAGKILARRGQFGAGRVVTFGKPRVGSSEFGFWRTVTAQHIVNQGDVVASLPPNAYLLLPEGGGVGSLVSFASSGPATFLISGGATLDGEPPDRIDAPSLIGSLVSNLGNAQEIVPHFMGVYLTRLRDSLRTRSPEAFADLESLTSLGFFS